MAHFVIEDQSFGTSELYQKENHKQLPELNHYRFDHGGFIEWHHYYKLSIESICGSIGPSYLCNYNYN